MLTKKEMEQITWAIKCMGGTTVNGIQEVPANNVIGLLERFSERIHKDDSKEESNGNEI